MNSHSLVEFFKKQILDFPNNMEKAAYWNTKFDHFARLFSHLSGRPFAFNVAIGVILIWFISGPLFGFSDTWQLIINTATTIITFLMVFLIQHTQNRDTEAMQVKLDELTLLRQHYIALAKEAREAKKEADKSKRATY
jgi:low affinity Fe/Cu permease